jgi:hypothetical protein
MFDWICISFDFDRKINILLIIFRERVYDG